MKYEIQALDGFLVIGQEVKLTNFQKKNLQISTEFWPRFNRNLRKAYLSQQGNWVKYAVTLKKEGELFYFCGIPQRTVIPEGFARLPIKAHRYLVATHLGPMKNIYETYHKLYKEIIPQHGFLPCREECLHFERYDYRFQWNSDDSVIEIWVPIQE